MKNNLLNGLIYLSFLIVVSWFSFQQLNTPDPVLPNSSADSYSAYRALEHIKMIAKEPHSGGTIAHEKVRNYIVDFCKKSRLETHIYNQTGMRQFGSTLVAGNSFNILAKLKGANSSKAVLVMSHYDSEPNSQGAADDGSGVASMLEVMDLLSKKKALKNDIYFLFTDLEEVGLLGAEAFVNANEVLGKVGMILNYEARGNSGANYTFETSSENGWIVREFSKAVDRPLANSLAYEIYKLMPNDTDFTRFKDTGISGLNSAFVDGYAYYHSAIDNPENIDLGSLQNQGDLMWQMVNHFGNIDLTNTKSEDVIFFSIFGAVVIYPLWIDWLFIVISLIGLLLLLIISSRKRVLQIKNVLIGSVSYLLSIILALGFAWLLTWAVLSINPHYSIFYNSSFYNASVYLWMFLGSTLLAWAAISTVTAKKLSVYERIIGGFIIHGILLILLKNTVPTGAFILYIPLLAASILLMSNIFNIPKWAPITDFLIPILPLILWVPFIYFLFIVFSFSIPYASAFFICLLFPYLDYLHAKFKSINPFLLPGLCFFIILFGFLAGQMTSNYSEENPLQTKLAYALSVDENKAFWVSNQKYKDEFNSNYIKSSKREKLTEIYPQSSRLYWKDNAPLVSLPRLEVFTERDTIVNGSRLIKMKVRAPREVTYFHLMLPEGANINSVNERNTEGLVNYLTYYAPTQSACEITLTVNKRGPIEITFIASHIGIGPNLLSTPLPTEFIFGTGRMSNNKLVKETIRL